MPFRKVLQTLRSVFTEETITCLGWELQRDSEPAAGSENASINIGARRAEEIPELQPMLITKSGSGLHQPAVQLPGETLLQETASSTTLESDDNFPFGMSFFEIRDSSGDFIQCVVPVYNGFHFARFKKSSHEF